MSPRVHVPKRHGDTIIRTIGVIVRVVCISHYAFLSFGLQIQRSHVTGEIKHCLVLVRVLQQNLIHFVIIVVVIIEMQGFVFL